MQVENTSAVDDRRLTLPHESPNYHTVKDAFYTEIPVSALRFNYEYQRDRERAEQWAKATFEKEGFVASKFGVIHVGEWEGEYFCWDGQGRTILATLANKPSVMCIVQPHCAPDQQAKFFTGQTNRRGLNWLDLHRAHLVEGLPIAIEIEKVLTRYGLKAQSSGEKAVRAVGSLYWIYDRGGHDLLDDVIDTASNCWPLSKDRFKDRILKGLAFLYESFDHRDMNRNEAKAAFRDQSPSQVLMEAARATKMSGGQNSTEIARFLLKAFNRANNRKLRSDRLDLNTDRRKRRTGQ